MSDLVHSQKSLLWKDPLVTFISLIATSNTYEAFALQLSNIIVKKSQDFISGQSIF
jgi:hypothetical protein